jgi:CRP/FNR family transcriptional regulator, cyclic AMP receptor protein
VCSKEPSDIRARDACDEIFYIKKGKIKLTVVSKEGKEATIAILNSSDFFGEGCLAAQPLRMGSATAMTDCELMRIENTAMQSALHRENKLSDMFVAYLLSLKHSVRRGPSRSTLQVQRKTPGPYTLAVGQFRKEGKPEKVIPKISQETLAEMVGTTRSRVSSTSEVSFP